MKTIYIYPSFIIAVATLFTAFSAIAEETHKIIDHTKHAHHPAYTEETSKVIDNTKHAHHHKEGGWDHNRVDSSGPIGVMADHTHHEKGGMLSYRYMRMDMRPNYIGDSQVTPAQALGAGFLITPLNMQTEMQMLGGMYAPSDELTLMFMLPHLDKSMRHLVANGTQFTTKTNGIGDFKFGGLLKIFDRDHQRAHINLIMSAPSGSTTEQGFVPPAGGVVRLPYPMQLGSGTWDFHPGITYLGQSGNISWGSQLLGTVHLGNNDEGYSLGNDITLSTWIAYRICDSLSTSFRVSGTSWKNIGGRDPLIRGPVPTANPNLRGGSSVDMFGGINYEFQKGTLKGHRIAFEAGNRVYQNLDGPQLGMDWMFLLGWQKEF